MKHDKKLVLTLHILRTQVHGGEGEEGGLYLTRNVCVREREYVC
jgi:hypothetical protein